MKKETADRIRWGGILLFIIYLLFLTYFLFFSERYGRTSVEGRQIRYNLVPFVEIRRFVSFREQLGAEAVFLNVAGNILAFIPFGLLLPIILRPMRKGIRVVIWGFLFSMSIELLQMLTRVGSFDVDDLLLNTTGALLGLILFRICNKVRRNYYGKAL